MRVLSIDPGATRCGWAVIETGPVYVDSGIFGLSRDVTKETFQAYRLRLIPYWVNQTTDLLTTYEPDRVVVEIVPAVGGGNFVVAAQSHLAATVATVIQTITELNGIENRQLAAGTIKRKVGGVKDASKVKVRNGVLETLPELEPRRSEWKKIFDETDAIAIGITGL